MRKFCENFLILLDRRRVFACASRGPFKGVFSSKSNILHATENFPCVLKQIFAYFGCVLKQIAAKIFAYVKDFQYLRGHRPRSQAHEPTSKVRSHDAAHTSVRSRSLYLRTSALACLPIRHTRQFPRSYVRSSQSACH